MAYWRFQESANLEKQYPDNRLRPQTLCLVNLISSASEQLAPNKSVNVLSY